MSDIQISICMVSFNTCDFLRNTLESIYQTPPVQSFEIIIVDNHSSDGTVEMLHRDYPDIQLIENTGNEGYTRPMNQALRAARGNYLVQLNPDTLVRPGAMDAMTEYMNVHPEVGILSPKVVNRDGTLQYQCRRSAARPWDVLTYFCGLSRLFPTNPKFGGYLMTYASPDATYEVQAVSGSCMFIRREVTGQIGFLDELFFAYQEDADFCFRARKAGWKIMYFHEAEILHFGGMGGSRVQPYKAIYEWHRSYYHYYRKNLAQDYFFLINWGMITAMGIKLILAMAANFLRKEKIVGSKKP